MQLTAIRIENYQRLQDVSLDVRGHLVLVGANDVGKSSLLRCLDLALGASTAQLYAQVGVDDLRDKTKPLLIEARLEGFAADDQALYPDEIDVDPLTQQASLTVQLLVGVDENETLAIERRAVGSGTGRQLSRDQITGLGWRFLSSSAQSRELREDRKSAVDDLLAAVELGADRDAFEKIAVDLTFALDASQALSALRKGLADQLSKALPEAVSAKDLSFVPGSAADADVLSDVRLQIQKAGVPHNLSEQSDGARALFAIALYDLMSVGANMVGIDEPEVHLHPTSQRSLARLLRSNPNQKIIATHSADIVGAFEPDSIVVIRPGGLAVQPAQGFLNSSEKLVVRWWVRDRLEPLTARRVIAVEGVSDRIVVERTAELLDVNLDRLGISLIEAGGKGDMPAIENLFGPNGFDIDLLQLVDEDAVKSTCKRLSSTEADLEQHGVFVSRKDLEAEYVRAIGAEELWDALIDSGLFGAQKVDAITPTGPDGAYSEEDVAKLCRGSKVEAAIVVAGLLTAETAGNIDSVRDILAKAGA